MCVRYLKVQWKKAVQILPYLLCYLMTAGLIMTIFFAGCSKILGQESMVGKMNIGVVVPEDDETAELAVSLVTSMDSVSSICQFHFLKDDEGKEALKDGKVYALIVIPDHLVQGILDGTNTPITIVSMKNAGMETKLFETLADSGIEMLSLAQTGIYAAEEYCSTDQALEEMAGQINLDLNDLYMRYAMSRTDLFDEEEISATGDLSFVTYYLGAGIVLLIMLCGVPYAFYFCNRNKSVEQKLKIQGMIAVKRTVVEFLAMALIHMCMTGLLLGIGFLVKDRAGIRIFDYGQICLACELLAVSILSFIQCIYAICRNLVWGIFTLFFTTILLLFLAGGFIPLVFLPDIFKTISGYLPATFWIRLMGQAFQSELQMDTMLQVAGIGMVSLLLSCLVSACCEGRREHR